MTEALTNSLVLASSQSSRTVEIVDKVFSGNNAMWIIGGAIAIIAIVFGTLHGIVKNTARERTRREIAAYIAEGAMTPEQGERLMKAGSEEDC